MARGVTGNSQRVVTQNFQSEKCLKSPTLPFHKYRHQAEREGLGDLTNFLGLEVTDKRRNQATRCPVTGCFLFSIKKTEEFRGLIGANQGFRGEGRPAHAHRGLGGHTGVGRVRKSRGGPRPSSSPAQVLMHSRGAEGVALATDFSSRY